MGYGADSFVLPEADVKDYTYFGVAVTQVQFAVMLAKQSKGQCPFCSVTGLTARYGSNKKHIRACARKFNQRRGSAKD